MSVGRITVDLIAKTGSFDTSIDRSAKLAERRAREIDQAFVKAGQAAAAGLALAGTAIAAWTATTIKQGAELTKLAQIANTSTSDLQKLAAGAKTVGIEQSKLADILKDTSERVGEFLQTGGGPMKDFFEQIAPKIGLTAKAFKDLSGPQALQLYVDSLQKAGLNQAEMTFYMEALSSDATALIPLLRDGGAGFKSWGDEAQRAGAVMRDDAIAAAKNLDEQIKRLTLQFDGWRTQIANEVLPRLDDLVEASGSLSEEFDGLLDVAARLAGFDGLPKFFDSLGETAAGAIDYVAGATKQIAGLLSVAEGIKNLDLSKIQSGLADALGATPTTARDEYAARQAARIGPPLPTVTVTATRPSGGGARPRSGGAVDEAAKAQQQLDELIAQSLARSNEALEQQAERWRDLVDPMRVYNRQLEQIRALADEGLLDPATALGAEFEIESARQAWLDSLTEIGDKAKETSSELDNFAKHAAENIQDAIGDALVNSTDASFREIAANFAKMIQRMLAEALAADIARAMFGDLVKGGSGDGMFGNFLSALVGSATGIPGRAIGGPVTSGTPYIVGERGPELFMPNTSGRIIPNHALAGGDGKMALTIVNNTSASIGNVREQRISETERALIIEEAVNAAWAQPNDPNSRASRVLNRNFNVRRSR